MHGGALHPLPQAGTKVGDGAQRAAEIVRKAFPEYTNHRYYLNIIGEILHFLGQDFVPKIPLLGRGGPPPPAIIFK